MFSQITFEDFLRVFISSEKMPDSKRQMMERCFEFYKFGIKNENERIERKLINTILRDK